MRIDRRVRALPWPEPYHGGRQDFAVTLSWPVVDGERLLAADFVRNRAKKNSWRSYGPDFRLVCSKKRSRAAVLYRDKGGASRHDLDKALDGFPAGSSWCYPEISERDEHALLRWLGVRESRNHGLPELAAWTAEAVRAEEQAARDARGKLRDEDVELCPEGLPPGLEDFIRRTVLPEDRVLLYKKGNVRGVCFQCRQRVRAAGQRFRQFEHVDCPACGAGVLAVLEGSGHFRAEFVENVATLQRGLDGETVFLRQWRLYRDPTARWEHIPGLLKETTRYAVRGNRAAKWQKEGKENWFGNVSRYDMDDWTRVKTVSRIYDGSYYFYLPPDWREQLPGPSLQYVDLEGWLHGPDEHQRERNPIRFLLDWARYPAVEKLWKAGYTGAVRQHVTRPDRKCRNAVNWRRASIREAVHFPVRLLKTWPPEQWSLERFQRGREVWALVEQGRLREGEAAGLLRADADLEHIRNALGRASLHRILRYLDGGRDAQLWRDYLADCVELGLDLDDRAVLFPRSLEAAHQGTISQMEYKKNPAQWEAFAKRLGRLDRLAWAEGGLLIRPPADAGELVLEGKALNHCVARYVGDMAKGKTTILLIRREAEPDRPFYTLEWREGRVVQCRTKHNRSYQADPEVREFVERWAERVAELDRRKGVGAA